LAEFVSFGWPDGLVGSRGVVAIHREWDVLAMPRANTISLADRDLVRGYGDANMGPAVAEIANPLPRTPWGSLPPRMRVLYITTPAGTGGWLADAFASDSASDVQLERVLGVAAGLGRLRSELFDAILISHQPGELDALQTVEGIRAGNPDQAIIVLGVQSEQEMAALCYEVGADSYLCVNTATTRALIWSVARTIERHALIAENRRLHQGEQHRLLQEHQEVDRLLAQQRVLIADLEEICGGSRPKAQGSGRGAVAGTPGVAPAATNDVLSLPRIREDERLDLDLPEPLVTHYRELLRAYVIMGSGNLTDEMNILAELLTTAGVTARQTMLLHLKVLEELIRGLGSRSARHVMNRADLLVVEVMIHLAECYRHRHLERIHPPRQLLLPGVEAA
jgi:CheY-like chemotaxis protein